MTEKYNIPEENSLDFMEGSRTTVSEHQDVEFDIDTGDIIISQEEKIVETKVIENKELGVSFKETVIQLSEHRQKETGIKRIKRREIVEYPESLRDEGGSYVFSENTQSLWGYLTDDKTSSGTKLGHRVAMGYGTYESNTAEWMKHHGRNPTQVKQHIQDGLYFGKVMPENKSDGKKTISSDGIEISDLFTTVGDYVWDDRISTPVYFFGTENKAFQEYLESILNNENVLSLIMERWELAGGGSKGGKLVYPNSDEFEKCCEDLKEDINKTFDSLVEDMKEWGRRAIHDPSYRLTKEEKDLKKDEFVAMKNYEIRQLEKQRLMCIKKGIPLFTGNRVRNMDFLKLLARGTETATLYTLAESTIPAVNTEGVTQLRWCHSDLAIIPTKKSLNILFFESE